MRLETVEQRGGVFCLSWDCGIAAHVSRLREQHNGDWRGEVLFSNGDVPLHRSSFNLNTDTGRKSTIAALAGSGGDIPWASLVNELCFEVVGRLERGAPVIEIKAQEEVPPEQFLIEPFLPLNQPSLLYGRGGSCKSYLGLLLAICVGLPWQNNPFGWAVPSRPVSTLILDWETDKNTIHRRLKRLLRGMDLPEAFWLNYRQCRGPLMSELETVEQAVMEKKIDFIVLDSAGRACGGDLKEAGPVNAFYSAISQMGVTSLIIHHLAKDEFTKQKTPFGSAYFENNSRSQWHIEKEQGNETDFTLSVSHTKVNDSAKHRAIGLRVRFDNTPGNEATAFEVCDLKDTEFADRLPLKERMASVLGPGPMAVKELAGELGTTEGTIRSKLNSNKGLFIRLGDKWALRTLDEP